MMMIIENRIFDLKKDQKRDLAKYRNIEYKRMNQKNV